ncbi:MAG: SBBP repeat-containing protein [Candidatus Auribacterota bacterium]|nr:SBBP repeat-containing protein [Candidatus Auribacterota bacterium]
MFYFIIGVLIIAFPITLTAQVMLDYSTYLGGSSCDYGQGVSIGTAGNAYITGSTRSSDFPTINPYQAEFQDGEYDAFVIKFDSTGSQLIFSTYLGGGNHDHGNSIDIEIGGESYITGSTYSSNFPIQNPYQASNSGNGDVFVSKLGSTGSQLIFSTYLGGDDFDQGLGLTLGTGGEVHVTGSTESLNFPNQNPYQASNNGWSEVFVSKLDSTGSQLIFSTYLGGSNYDFGSGIILGTGGEAHVTGHTESLDFPVQNPYQVTNGGGRDVFVSRFCSTGSQLIFSTYLGGNNDDFGNSIAMGMEDEAYITGYTGSLDFPVQNPYQGEFQGGGYDVFVSKLGSTGSQLIFSTYLGGSDPDVGNGIALGMAGEAYVMGYTASLNFPTKNSYQDKNKGSYDIFVSKFMSSGSQLNFSTYFGGSGFEETGGGALDTGSGVYVIGLTQSFNFPTRNPYQASNNGEWDVFVSKFNYSASPSPSPTPTPEGYKTPSPSVTPTSIPSPSVTPTVTPTPSGIPTPNPTTSPSSHAPPWIHDYNGDETSDIAIFRETSGLWAVRGITRVYFGSSTDETVPGDYNGDGTTEIGIFRGTSGLWAIRGTTRVYFGSASDLPEQGDYDGDGTADMGIFRSGSGLWAIRGVTRVYFGGSSDSPASGYYDGDSTKDIGIFRGTSGLWAIRSITRVYFGSSLDTIVPGDYNGNGNWEVGVFRGTSGLWAIRNVTRSYFGSGVDQPVPGDYKGDGKDNIGIFRSTSGLWAIGGVTRVYFGGSSDTPVTR